jgi:F0F1-type ATP synthase membrane subunit c/vacuolar-type H+-ATPase subunit K
MKARTILLAIALACGLATISEAKTVRTSSANSKAAATARKRAKKQAKARAKMVRKSTKTKYVVHKPSKH